MTRSEFSSAIKRRAAERVGYLCSIPWCGASTIGPGSLESSAVSLGQAAHIYAASPSGPRGQAGLSDAQLRALDNAIWCCPRHASLIDSEDGRAFSPDTLAGYRELAELRAALRRDGFAPPPAGWFHQLRLASSPWLAPDACIRLGKNTLIYGRSGVGKTAATDLLAGLSDITRWERWIPAAAVATEEPIEARIEYFDPEPHEVTVRITGSAVERALDTRPSFVLPGRVVVRRLSLADARVPYRNGGSSDELDAARPAPPLDIPDVAGALGISQSSLLSAVRAYRGRLLHRLTVRDGELLVQMPDSPHLLPFGVLSGTERDRVMIALTVAVVSEQAAHAPTLLIVDDLAAIFDETTSRMVLSELGHAGAPFQTIATMLDPPPPELEHWEVVELAGQPRTRFERRVPKPWVAGD